MHRTRKLALLLLLTACFLAAGASLALAEVGSGYVNWGDVSSLPGQGTSPHGGYSTTTVKCAVCHAVHQANAGDSQLLLKSSVANACSYCHIDSSTGYTQVYDSNIANYSGTDHKNAHNTYEVAGVEQGITCTKCHSVHAAGTLMTANSYLTRRLLIGGKVYTGTNYDPVAQAPLSTDDSRTALSKWCAGCHFTKGGNTYWGADYNGQSHIMTTATATYSNSAAGYNGQVAWNDSTYCSSCHNSQFQTPAWPHFTTGQRFLTAGSNSAESLPATSTSGDAVCLRCHRDTGGNGVGLGF